MNTKGVAAETKGVAAHLSPLLVLNCMFYGVDQNTGNRYVAVFNVLVVRFQCDLNWFESCKR